MKNRKTLKILGIRGIPAKHGGFETFAEHFSVYMAEHGWHVQVYCQKTGQFRITKNRYKNVETINIPCFFDSTLGTLIFDSLSTIHAAICPGICLTLGYNTAFLCLLPRIFGRKTIINMDGIEWKRKKWSWPLRAWLYANEWLGARFNHRLIADHPEISKHLERHTRLSKIETITYGAEPQPYNDTSILTALGTKAQEYAILIARAEPENSIKEIVTAWSSKQRNMKLIVLGKYSRMNKYQDSVLRASSDQILFPGAIYEPSSIATLRRNAAFYIHGHQVGGTNPSLVEALSYKNPIIAHNNPFNQWVANDSALYFETIEDCENAIDELTSNPGLRYSLSDRAAARHIEEFRLNDIHEKYRILIEGFVKK